GPGGERMLFAFRTTSSTATRRPTPAATRRPAACHALAVLTAVGAALFVQCASTPSDEGNGEAATAVGSCAGATFGKTTPGTTWLKATQDLKRVSPFSSPVSNAAVSKLTVYVDGLGAT